MAKEMNMKNVNGKLCTESVLIGMGCGWSLYTMPFQNRFDPLVFNIYMQL